MQTKTSAGIICYRFNNKLKRYEVLMVRHRYTYEFSSFVKGYYNGNNTKRIVNLFNKMTIQEKIDIMSLNYDIIWFRLWCSWPSEFSDYKEWTDIFKKQKTIDIINAPQTNKKRKFFVKKKKHFEDIFCRDNGSYLRHILNKSNKSAKLLWELPKGRVDKYENTLKTAKREFDEETHINESKYTLKHCRPIIESFIDMSVKYKFVFYFAECNHEISLNVNPSKPSQSLEIDEIQWIGSQDIPQYCHSARVANRMKRIFKVIRSLKCENLSNV